MGTAARRPDATDEAIDPESSQTRANRIRELPLDYIANPEFNMPHAWKRILGPMPNADQKSRPVRRPSGLPPYLASLYEVPLLTREQEAHLFRKYNYLKYRAGRRREKLDPARPQRNLVAEIEQLYAQAVATRNHVIRANLRLVVSVCKRHLGQIHDFFELVSDGNMSLIRAVEKFDYSRGNKFSTYATWAIRKNFVRTLSVQRRQRERFQTGQDAVFSYTPEYRSSPREQEGVQRDRAALIRRILKHLDEREQRVIACRFGVGWEQRAKTLKEVGAALGVTKERVRQVQARAMDKLRSSIQPNRSQAPGDGNGACEA